MPITSELRRVVEQQRTLPLAEAQALMGRILAREVSDIELAALLAGLAARGESSEEIAGFALAMRSAATMLPLTETERDELVDTCGTGGDGSGTFNISTAAALVAAAAGVKVAKHGNRAVTSSCGSADVLEALGIPISLEPQAAVDVLRKHGFCFLLAPAHHPAMAAVMPVRRALGVRTIFNVLGPLLNPAGTRRQLLGVYTDRLVWPVARAMTHLGITKAMVVHGWGGLDELALSGPSELITVRHEARETLTQSAVTPEQFGFARAPVGTLAGGADAAANARILHAIFRGESGPRRDVVVLNAAAVLVLADRACDMKEGIALAQQTIDSGAVLQLIETLRVVP